MLLPPPESFPSSPGSINQSTFATALRVCLFCPGAQTTHMVWLLIFGGGGWGGGGVRHLFSPPGKSWIS